MLVPDVVLVVVRQHGEIDLLVGAHQAVAVVVHELVESVVSEELVVEVVLVVLVVVVQFSAAEAVYYAEYTQEFTVG